MSYKAQISTFIISFLKSSCKYFLCSSSHSSFSSCFKFRLNTFDFSHLPQLLAAAATGVGLFCQVGCYYTFFIALRSNIFYIT